MGMAHDMVLSLMEKCNPVSLKVETGTGRFAASARSKRTQHTQRKASSSTARRTIKGIPEVQGSDAHGLRTRLLARRAPRGREHTCLVQDNTRRTNEEKTDSKRGPMEYDVEPQRLLSQI
jgi:hypothetical protein